MEHDGYPASSPLSGCCLTRGLHYSAIVRAPDTSSIVGARTFWVDEDEDDYVDELFSVAWNGSGRHGKQEICLHPRRWRAIDLTMVDRPKRAPWLHLGICGRVRKNGAVQSTPLQCKRFADGFNNVRYIWFWSDRCGLPWKQWELSSCCVFDAYCTVRLWPRLRL